LYFHFDVVSSDGPPYKSCGIKTTLLPNGSIDERKQNRRKKHQEKRCENQGS